MSEITAQVSSSIDSLTQEFDIITQNLANVSTVGYKRIRGAFLKSLEAQDAGSETGGVDLNTTFDFSFCRPILRLR